MSNTEPPARLFIGSSSEGLAVARNLHAELEAQRVCEVDRWDQNVFEPSGYTLDSLLSVASEVDFAVLIATADDIVISRGEQAQAMRDNVLFELGLFFGALGRTRTYFMPVIRPEQSTADLRLPSDLQGLTRLPYTARRDNNLRAAVNAAVLQIEREVGRHGRRYRPSRSAGNGGSDRAALDAEIDILCGNAVAQGWAVKANSPTTLRLRSPRGRTLTLQKGRPMTTRVELRRFAANLRAAGLRVNSSIRRPVEESPF